MTVPEAAAWIGAPIGAPMSIPSCIRPQRTPNGLVTGPAAGQISPASEGEVGLLECDSAPLIWASIAALDAASAFASAMNCCSAFRTAASASWLPARAP